MDRRTVKIVFDALGLPRYGGARSSAVGWLAALARYGPQHRYWALVSRREPELEGLANLEQRVAPDVSRFLLRIWAQASIPSFLNHIGADLFHATKNLGVFGAPCPVLITVNDVTHVDLAGYYPWLDNLYWKRIQPQMLRHAARIIAISQSTRQGLMRNYGLESSSIEVIYPSCHPRYGRDMDEASLATIRERYDLPESYILYVGGLGLHKNVATLVSSFEKIAGHVPHSLVLVGGNYHTSSDQALFRELSTRGRERRIWLLDGVSDDDMSGIYQMADLFVLPSLSEGFGLTLIEAMASGVPVVAGRIGAVPEVVGDAGILLDDIEDQTMLAEAVRSLLDSPSMRDILRKRGRAQAAMFTWEATAKRTLFLYESVLSGDNLGRA